MFVLADFKSISKSFDSLPVLTDFSLKLGEGSRTVIMGESGCGKTTLLKIAAGLISADNGEFSHDGNIAFMFQEPRLLPWKSALENIVAVLKEKNLALAEKYLDAVSLTDARDKLPHELSGGMAQRVAFARFLAFAEETDANLLLLDEPFSALDSETADSMIALLGRFSQGKAFLLVTHNEEHAKKLEAEIIRL